MMNWGATQQEIEETLPGDEIAGPAKYRSTRAVTVNAPVELVWPWLVQLGQGRGGLYSYDWLENLLRLDIHSADRIVPDYQHLAVGDVVRLVPEGTQPPLRFVVQQVEPPHLLVLGPDGSRQEGWVAYKYALAPVHLVMERKMLLGIKHRAERTKRTGRIAGRGSGSR